MGNIIYVNKCCACKSNKATYKKTITYKIPDCECNFIIIPKIKPIYFSDKLIFNNRCACNRSIAISECNKKVLSDYRNCLEFLSHIPSNDTFHRDFITDIKREEIDYYFYGCDDCMKYRPWTYDVLEKIDNNI